MRRPAARRKNRDTFVTGKTGQNAVKSMVLTDTEGRVLSCSPVRPGRCADITQARQLGLAQFLADGPFVGILAHARYQGMGAQTSRRVMPRPIASSRRTLPPGTRNGTNYTARRTPHDASASCTALHT
ncbi:transposase family protein [Streptomyces sp. NPDC090499]|uniref:transposase family protein n=1 Tax=Streptomyces sp. NPDC090499 TaxID=3365965 RepID=UPI0038076C01